MKISELLKEDRKQKIAAEEAARVALINCTDALKFKHTPIVRGMSGEHCHILNGEAGGRTSKNSSNHYTLILDEILPESGFPLRSKSTICENWEGRANTRMYGNLHVILPFNGVKIGVCPQADIWHTEVTIGEYTKDLNIWNDEFEMREVRDASYDTIVNDITQGGSLSKDEDDEYVRWFRRVFGNNKGEYNATRVDKMLRQAYSPEALKLALTTTKNPTFNDGKQHELWFSGKCVAMPFKDYKEWILDGKPDDSERDVSDFL